MTIQNMLFALLIVAIATQGWAFLPSQRASCSQTFSAKDISTCIPKQSSPLFLSDTTEEAEVDPKTKLAMDLQRLFDIDQMAYTVMVREENKGPDGKLTPEQLIAAIQKDGMFGEDVEEYIEKYASEGDVEILDIGKFSDDMESSEPLPDDANLTIPGKGSYLVYLSFAEGIRATMRIVVD